MANVVRTGELYPVAEGEKLPTGVPARLARVKATGEFRAPREGEWYLSGAIAEGYRAHVDLMTKFHIGTLMVGTEHTTITWEESRNN